MKQGATNEATATAPPRTVSRPWRSYVRFSELKELPDLQTLHLEETAVTDSALDHLKSMTRLRALYFHNNKVTDAGAHELERALSEAVIAH